MLTTTTKIERRIRTRLATQGLVTEDKVIASLARTIKRDNLRRRGAHAFQRDAFRAHMATRHPGQSEPCDGSCVW